MNAAHFAFGALVGMALIEIARFAYAYFLRPRKMHMRDYYDVYYGHCKDCMVSE